MKEQLKLILEQHMETLTAEQQNALVDAINSPEIKMQCDKHGCRELLCGCPITELQGD